MKVQAVRRPYRTPAIEQIAFTGFYVVRLDPKGRFSIPSVFREIIGRIKTFLVLEEKERAAILLEGLWEKTRTKLKDEDRNRFSSRTFELKIDRNGRAAIHQSAVENFGFKGKRELVVTGEGNRLRLWSKERWERERGNFPQATLRS